MDVDRFRNSPIGHLTPIRVEQQGRVIEHYAFVPDRLPDAVDLRAETYVAMEAAAIELGALEGAAEQFASPYAITRPSIRREAVSTSALEGTFATLEDMFAVDLEGGEATSGAVREVANYVSAAEHGVRALAERPVSLNLVCELHRILLQGTPYESTAGRLRTSQVAIGRPGALIKIGRAHV